MNTYIKKPVAIQAVQWSGFNFSEIKDFCGESASIENTCENGPQLVIKTLEGSLTASKYSYIIKGVKGEFYPCEPEIFKLTYLTQKEYAKRLEK